MLNTHGSAAGAVSEAIGAIYDAGLSPSAWAQALSHLKAMFNLANTAYLVHDVDRTHVQRVTAEFDPEGQRLNVESLLRVNSHLLRGKTGYTGQVVRMAEVLPSRAFYRSSMYEQFWRPRGLHDGLRMTVAIDEAGIHHAVNMHRAKPAHLFDTADFALAHTLMPHLQRAVAVRRRLGHADLLATSALSAMETLAHAVLLLDRAGRILHANVPADRLLSGRDGLRVVEGRLHGATQPVTSRLDAILAQAAGAGRMPARAGALRLPRLGPAAPLALLAMPLGSAADWTMPGGPAILLTITDPQSSSPPAADHLAALFGLTAAEASLAVDLLSGLDTREIAARSGRSVTTVRTHLVRLMAKADVSRQSELMRVLGSLPRGSDKI